MTEPTPHEPTPHGSLPHGAPSSRAVSRFARSSSRIVADRVRAAFMARGGGFRRLAESHAGAVAGDTLVAMALAGTLFFAVPSTEARDNVALYLLLTLAPFAVIGPFLGGVYERFPAAYRGGLVLSSALRAVLAFIMIFFVDSLVLFPLAFLLLVLSRFHGISKSSLLPVIIDKPLELVAANAQLARLGILGGALAVPFGALALWRDLPLIALLAGIGAYLYSAHAARSLPALDHARVYAVTHPRHRRRLSPPRPVRLTRFATAAVRYLNGFLLLLVAFAFRDADAGFLDFGALLAAGSVGFFLAALATPVLERRISEEPMVVMALAVEAGAAFVAAQFFGLAAAAVLAAAAGFAWGVAKFGFDGLLQATVPIQHRGRAFTNSETMFQVAWVLGALIPVLPAIPVEGGLAVAGLAALIIQVIYVSATMLPLAHARRQVLLEQLAAEAEMQHEAPPADPPEEHGDDILGLF